MSNYQVTITTNKYKQKLELLKNTAPRRIFYKQFDFNILKQLKYPEGKNSWCPFFLTIDTETSKTYLEYIEGKDNPNFIVTWQVCLYYNDWSWSSSSKKVKGNEAFCLATVFGRTPSSLCEFIADIARNIKSSNLLAYIHNLSYDMVFLNPWFNQAFENDSNLIMSAHHFLYEKWNIGNGKMLEIRDSYALYPTKLAKFCAEMNTEHGKTDSWDYNKLRTQNSYITPEEQEYMENDVLGLAEALVKQFQALAEDDFKVSYSTIPYTKTGIPRKKIYNAYRKQEKQDWWDFLPDETLYLLMEACFHGGYTHGARKYNGQVVKGKIRHLDIKSSYPFVMCCKPMPSTPFVKSMITDINTVLSYDIYKKGFMGFFEFHNIRLKNPDEQLVLLQASKTLEIMHSHTDNGRIVESEKATIALTSIDLYDISRYYDWDSCDILMLYECEMALDDKWFRDLVFESFAKKETLPKDSLGYGYQKALTNSMYGCSVMKYLRKQWTYDMETGVFSSKDMTWAEFINAKGTKKKCQQFQKGVFVTSWAMNSLLEMNELCETWLYSDTDSMFGLGLDEEKLAKVNEKRLQELVNAGYGLVKNRKGEWSQLGIFDSESDATEFVVLGAKRYCQRLADTGKLQYTVAGVPKGFEDEILHDDISNFKKGLEFNPNITNKKTAFHVNGVTPYIDEMGNEVSDWIDLVPCTYLLDSLENEILKYSDATIIGGEEL